MPIDQPSEARARQSEPGRTQHRAVYVISVAAEIAGVHPRPSASTSARVSSTRLAPSAGVGGTPRPTSRCSGGSPTSPTKGLNLVGVKKVIALEAEVERLRVEVAEARDAVGEAVESTHRHYRRDLVPCVGVTVFGRVDLPER